MVFESLHWVLVYLNSVFLGTNPHIFLLYMHSYFYLCPYIVYRYSISLLISILRDIIKSCGGGVEVEKEKTYPSVSNFTTK